MHTGRPPCEGLMLALVRPYVPDKEAQGLAAAKQARRVKALVVFKVRPERWRTSDFADEAG